MKEKNSIVWLQHRILNGKEYIIYSLDKNTLCFKIIDIYHFIQNFKIKSKFYF